jgi:hypothetical protein
MPGVDLVPGTSGVYSIAFSDRGRRLVTGSADSTALVWSVPASEDDESRSSVLKADQFDALRNDLLGDDATKAYQAILTLQAAPRQAMPLLRARLKPVTEPGPKELQQLVANLDSNQFALRMNADSELEKLGALADEALKKGLAAGPARSCACLPNK